MFNSIATVQFILSIQLSHGLDAWQSWSDRNLSQLQSLILGTITLFAYSAGVIAAGGYWLTAWASTVLFIAGVDQCDRYLFYTAPVAISASAPVASIISLGSLDIFDTFVTAVLSVNACAMADYGLLAASTY